MELPFLKNKKNQGGGGPLAEQTRTPDDGTDMLGAVASEMLDAYSRKDKAALRAALRAFVQLIKDEDSDG